MIRIVVVDDHLVTRRGVISLVAENEEIQVVGEGAAGNELFDLLDEYRPQVLITDLEMPAHADNPKGPLFAPISAMQKVRREYPDTAILVLSQADDIQTMQSLAEVGVQGYMLKTDDFAEVLDKAVEIIHLGATYFSPEAKEAIFSAPRLNSEGPLTDRQLDVLSAIIRSPASSREEIAQSLHISGSTLQKHIGAIFSALGVPNMESVIIKAMRMRLVDQEGNLVLSSSEAPE